MEEEKIDPGHRGVRNVFRIVGPIIALAGLIFIIVGIVGFFSGFGLGSPKYVWCPFVGMPLLFVGTVLSVLGYMGRLARYQAGEIAPIGKDTFNYMADGTKEGIKTVARAIGEGLGGSLAGGGAAAGEPQTKVRCHKCNALAEENAKFCSECGAPVSKTKCCPQCNELNDPDAKFCDNCGNNFTR